MLIKRETCYQMSISEHLRVNLNFVKAARSSCRAMTTGPYDLVRRAADRRRLLAIDGRQVSLF